MRDMIRIFLCGMALLAVLVAPAIAQQAKPPAKPPSSEKKIDPQLAAMAKELKLTAAQQEKMQRKIESLQAAVKAWSSKNQDKMTKLTTDLQSATKAKDETKAKSLQDQLMKLMKERNDLITRGGKDIMSELTPAQQQAWEEHMMLQGVILPYKTLNLSKEQLAKIKGMCKTAVVAAKKLPENDIQARMKFHNKLLNDIEQKVLTVAQRAQLKAEEEKMRAKMEQMKKSAPKK